MTALLEARGIRKQFPGVLALDGAGAAVHAGEVLAIVGENGAGKSTLMNVLAGMIPPDSGTLLLNGREVRFPNVQAAMAAGIALVHQELNLADNLSVTDNVFLGREQSVLGWRREMPMRRAAEGVLAKVGLPPRLAAATVGRLPPGHKQLVEIARALAMQARAIIMDEPTSSLTQAETERLYDVIDSLKAAGVGVVYISHRLNEVLRVADRAVVLRDGRNAGELQKSELSHDNLVRLMVGRDLRGQARSARPATAGSATPALALRNLRVEGSSHAVNLEIRPGEVLGMAGLVGAGRTELAEAAFGLRRILGGQVEVHGMAITPRHPREAIRAGLGMVPEDRRRHGLIHPESVEFNAALPSLPRLSVLGLIRRGAVRRLCLNWMERLRIRARSPAQPVGLLSGGNQQKVVFAKWLAREPRVLILDEPTRGVDVGARGELYAIIAELVSRGVAVWMISSDMEELLAVSDRIAVLHEGRLAGILARGDFHEERIMHLATGGTP